jgi:hypothetical protein
MIQNYLGRFGGASGVKKGKLKMKATPTMLLKTHVEKMSVLATPTIFMKSIDLNRHSHDMHENKGSCSPGWGRPGTPEGRTPEAEVTTAGVQFPAAKKR